MIREMIGSTGSGSTSGAVSVVAIVRMVQGGQYTIVFPEQDAVLSINSDVEDMQKVLDVIWKHFRPVFAKTPTLPTDPEGAAMLRHRCAELALAPVSGKKDGADEFYGTYFPFKTSTAWFKGVRIDRKGDGWEARLTTAAGEYTIPVGYHKWAFGEAVFSPRKHEPLGDVVGTQKLAASAAVQDDGSLKVRIHQLSGMRRLDLRFCRKFFKKAVEGRVVGQSAIKTKWL